MADLFQFSLDPHDNLLDEDPVIDEVSVLCVNVFPATRHVHWFMQAEGELEIAGERRVDGVESDNSSGSGEHIEYSPEYAVSE